MSIKLESYGFSDAGLREKNEDAHKEEGTFFVLADGLGGRQGGEVASNKAIDLLCKSIKLSESEKVQTEKEWIDVLRLAIDAANVAICNLAVKHPSLRGMGTTVCCLYFYLNSVIYAHVGDSRIYRLRDRKLEPLTVDHSLASALIESGELKKDDLPKFPLKHIVTRALGSNIASENEPTINTSKVLPGDIYMICSDGLTDYVLDEEVQTEMLRHESLKESVHALIDLAKQKNSKDNITVLLIRVLVD